MQSITDPQASLPEKTAAEIISYINEKSFKPGDKLPNEYEFSHQLGVSRNTVREAIRSLVSWNILEIRRGAGTFISLKKGVADDPLGFSLVQDKSKLALDLMQIRLMIEPGIAALAAQNSEKEDLEILESICCELEENILSGKDYTQKDVEFHTQIASCSKNIVMPSLLPVIHDALTLFADITDIRDGMNTIKTHRKIVDAIKENRSCDAQNLMLSHLMYNQDRIVNVLKTYDGNTEKGE